MGGGADAHPRTFGARRDRGRWRRRLLAVALSLLVSLTVAEVVARVRFGAPLPERLPISRIQANPHRGWEMVPGEAHYTYRHLVRINAHGLRGPEIPPRAEDGPRELRVLALGDSLVYGQGVADDQTLPALLEQRLSATDPETRRWRVINAGHRAYDTHQELALLRELGPELAPDVVILFWFWNDLKERDIPDTYARLKASGPVAFDVGAPMEGWTEIRWRLGQIARKSALVMWLHDRLGAARAGPLGRAYVEDGLKQLDRYLAQLHELGERLGFLPVFVAVPEAGLLSGPHPGGAITDAALELAGTHRLPVLDLMDPVHALHEATGTPPVIPYDGHYTAAANAAMAERTAEFLIATLADDGR
ncbi:MAG: GDSL-type esterase/lipase family protein [Planctomycetota bacterium]|nr:GDSL-type esterase/lipase family protein [Planctomycetota bacterium]